MHSLALTITVIMANVLGASMAIPQARKLLRTRRADGISLTWAIVSAAVNAWWGIYAVGVADLSILPVSVVSVGAYVAIAVGIVRYAHGAALSIGARSSALIMFVMIIPLFATHIGGWTAAGVVLGALYGVQLAPAVVAVYRTADVSGVSVATWVIALAEAALWGLYGFAGADVGLLTLAATGVTMSALVLARLVARRPRRTRIDTTAGATVGLQGLAAA